MLHEHDLEKGMCVRFLAKNASEFEINNASKVLSKGECYHVSKIYVDMWGCYIYLDEVPNRSFKSIMFEDAGAYIQKKKLRK
ncbi:hypothetical protein QO179_23660 [Bacillus stercoris]|nr:hypothetical protein [Bacillus stercoris]